MPGRGPVQPMVRAFVAALLALAATAVVFVGAAGGAPKEKGKLRLTLKAQTLVPVDIGPAGDSPGDVVTGTDTVLRRGRAIGRAYSSCILISGTGTDGRLDCTGTLILPGGRIVTQQEVLTKGESSSPWARSPAARGSTGRHAVT